jgi:hypothetical protein
MAAAQGNSNNIINTFWFQATSNNVNSKNNNSGILMTGS